MSPKDIILHLRFPFSVFLMPIFLLACSQQLQADFYSNCIIGFVLHILVYPASNAYNSYHDKDETSIGGLKNPPKVSKQLYWVASFMDIVSVIISALFINYEFGACVLLYILVSRAYSWPGIRLKKYAILSWFTVGLFQGALVYFLVYIFGQKLSLSEGFTFLNVNDFLPIWGAAISAIILWCVYPITQVYQHESDRAAGDITMSIKLGINGTFYFAILVYPVSLILSYFYFSTNQFLVFSVASLCISGYLFWWFLKVLKDQKMANFDYTMKMNLLSSLVLNFCFGILNFI